MYYEQTYIDTLWCEFTIPPTPSGDFRLSPNHLHIWPKQTHMFIAIPSEDRSFTSTLFMPASIFSSLTTPTDITAFFAEHYPDVLAILGPDDLTAQFQSHDHLPLISIRAAPYHHRTNAVILGDAAHAMVPFYGQGMNAGFESVEVLFRHRAANGDLDLVAFSEERVDDAWAIVELAMRNYDEMRSGVTKRGYLLRKAVEEACARWAPWTGVKTLYSMVSFGTDRYSRVLRKANKQYVVEEWVLAGTVAAAVAAGMWRAGVGRAVRVGFAEGWKALVGNR